MLEDDISTGLSVLQSHLDGMLDRVQQNSLTLKRLQAYEMRLLGLSSLAEMIDFILSETQSLFGLDIVTLCLCDAKGEIASYLADDHYAYQARDGLFLLDSDQLFLRHFALSNRPLLGKFQAGLYGELFGSTSQAPSSVILVPLIRRGKYLGSLNFGSYRTDRFVNNMATDFIEHLASVIGVCLENTFNFETLRRTSLIDPLTGVNNRRFLEQRIEEELDRSQRTRMPLSCLFLDIDFFKRINDSFGHQAGDHVLAMIATAIKKQLRSNDVLARYGGEEFVALLLESEAVAATAIAERIRNTIAELRLDFNDQTMPVTISIGTATHDPNKSNAKGVSEKAVELIQAADTALYKAKHEGRNRVKNGGIV